MYMAVMINSILGISQPNNMCIYHKESYLTPHICSETHSAVFTLASILATAMPWPVGHCPQIDSVLDKALNNQIKTMFMIICSRNMLV
jgi:hypothetical protein